LSKKEKQKPSLTGRRKDGKEEGEPKAGDSGGAWKEQREGHLPLAVEKTEEAGLKKKKKERTDDALRGVRPRGYGGWERISSEKTQWNEAGLQRGSLARNITGKEKGFSGAQRRGGGHFKLVNGKTIIQEKRLGAKRLKPPGKREGMRLVRPWEK